MKKIYIICLSLAIAGLFKQPVFAGWPVGKHRTVVVPSFNYYRATDFYDQSGHVVKGTNGYGFTSVAYGLNLGYGITRRLDLVANVLAPYHLSTYPALNQEAFGFGDLQTGLSYNLVNVHNRSYLSLQATGIIPLYKNYSDYLTLGYGTFGTEVKLMYTGSLVNSFLRGCYYNLETGYRRFYDYDGPDIFVYNASLGYPLNKNNQLNIEISGQDASSSNKTFSQNLPNNRDYAFTKGALNYGYTINRRYTVFAGGFYTLTGRNTGVGYGGSVQAVIKL